MRITKKDRAALRKASAKWPEELTRVAVPPGHIGPPNQIEVWRSRRYLVQVFQQAPGILRLSVCRAALNDGGNRWAEGITWDDLQRLKRECGRGDYDALEIYPRDRDVVNVANMRHLWVFTDRLIEFAWRATP